jgi:hypothetical protein
MGILVTYPLLYHGHFMSCCLISSVFERYGHYFMFLGILKDEKGDLSLI